MGGNALAAQGAKRIDKFQYNILKGEIFEKLSTLRGFYGWVEIPSFKDKDTFGDIDILCTNVTNEVFEQVLDLFKRPACYRNTNVLSLLYKDLQVDLISMDPENYNTAKVYYSYNDLGNLMGKIYHKFGLKYGHKGLVMPLRDDTNSSHKFDEVIISKNPEKIFGFIGLEYFEFLLGFSSLNKIFRFVTSSPYFHPDIFSFENMNNTARVRDRKRSTYNEFLAYIDGMDIDPLPSWDKDKSKYLDKIFTFFPESYAGYLRSLAEFEKHKAMQAKFNGTKVLGWLKDSYPEGIVHGFHFGNFMKWMLEDKIGIGTKELWIESNTEDWLKQCVIMWYSEWRSTVFTSLLV